MPPGNSRYIVFYVSRWLSRPMTAVICIPVSVLYRPAVTAVGLREKCARGSSSRGVMSPRMWIASFRLSVFSYLFYYDCFFFYYYFCLHEKSYPALPVTVRPHRWKPRSGEWLFPSKTRVTFLPVWYLRRAINLMARRYVKINPFPEKSMAVIPGYACTSVGNSDLLR